MFRPYDNPSVAFRRQLPLHRGAYLLTSAQSNLYPRGAGPSAMSCALLIFAGIGVNRLALGTPNTHYVRIGEPLPPVDGLSALSYKTAPHSANIAARTADLITSDSSV